MAELKLVRRGIATTLKDVQGLRAVATVPGDLSVPGALVRPGRIAFDQAMRRGVDEMEFIVHLVTSRAWDRTGQDLLDDFLAGSGSKSVKAAFESDLGKTLYNTPGVQWAWLSEMTDYGPVEFGETGYFGCDLTIGVSVDGIT